MRKRICLIAASIVLAFSMAAIQPIMAEEGETEIQDDYWVTLPEGTILPIVLTAYLNTKNSQAGDTVYATVLYPIWQQQKLVIPKGSEVRGTVTDVVRPGRIKGKGQMSIRFDDILLPNGVKRDLTASFRGIHGPGDENLDRETESVSGSASKGKDAETIAVLAGQGTSIGTLAGGIGAGRYGTGAAIGAGAGAVAGVVTVLLTRGKDLVLEPGMQFDLELLKPLDFSYYDLEFNRSQLDDARQSVQPNTPARHREESGRTSGRIWPLPRIGFPF